MYKISHRASVPRPLRGTYYSYEFARRALRKYVRNRNWVRGQWQPTMEFFNTLGFKIRKVM